MVPDWLIDDTAELGDARVFVAHTVAPRFFAELVPDDEAALDGVVISGLPGHEVLIVHRWVDKPIFNAAELVASLSEALRQHWAIRERD